MSDAAPAAVPQALTGLDERVEAATGLSVDELWDGDPRLADSCVARVAFAHRQLAEATHAVTFQRDLLARLSSGEFGVDAVLIERIDQTVDELEKAAGRRDERTADLLDALHPLEEAARTRTRDQAGCLDPVDHATLVALAPGGAALHEHLLTGSSDVQCASGTRLPAGLLQRLEEQGLAHRNTAHVPSAGVPVTLTERGHRALERAEEHARTARGTDRTGHGPACYASHQTTEAKEAHDHHR